MGVHLRDFEPPDLDDPEPSIEVQKAWEEGFYWGQKVQESESAIQYRLMAIAAFIAGLVIMGMIMVMVFGGR